MTESTLNTSLTQQAIDMMQSIQAKPFHNFDLQIYDFRLDLFDGKQDERVMTLSFIIKGHGDNKSMYYLLDYNDNHPDHLGNHPERIGNELFELNDLYHNDDANLGFMVVWFTKLYEAFDLTNKSILKARNFFSQTLPLAQVI
jgi:hypothetical protein